MEKLVPKLRFPEFEGEWKKITLGEISSFISKGTTPKQFTNQGINYIKIESLNGINIIKDKCVFIDENTHLFELKRSILEENDILFAIAGATVGKIGIVTDDILPANTNQALAIIRLKNKSLVNFILFVLDSNKMKKYIQESISVGAQPNLNLQQINNFDFYSPNDLEQQKIASFLTSVDERIILLEKQKQGMETYKKGVMQQLFSQQLRFKDDAGKDFPDWEEKKFNEIIERTSTGLNPRQNFTLGKGNNYYVTIKNISNGKLDFSSCEMIDDDALKMIKKRSDLSKNDIIMSSIGNIGEAYLLKEEPTNWNINESVFMIRSNAEVVMPLFLFYILSNDFTKKYFENNMTGSSFKSIKIGDLKLMPVQIPCLEEQQKIASFLSAIDARIEVVSKQIEQSKVFKKGLLQQMFV